MYFPNQQDDQSVSVMYVLKFPPKMPPELKRYIKLIKNDLYSLFLEAVL
jgi:hypothetical protein